MGWFLVVCGVILVTGVTAREDRGPPPPPLPPKVPMPDDDGPIIVVGYRAGKDFGKNHHERPGPNNEWPKDVPQPPPPPPPPSKPEPPRRPHPPHPESGRGEPGYERGGPGYDKLAPGYDKGYGLEGQHGHGSPPAKGGYYNKYDGPNSKLRNAGKFYDNYDGKRDNYDGPAHLDGHYPQKNDGHFGGRNAYGGDISPLQFLVNQKNPFAPYEGLPPPKQHMRKGHYDDHDGAYPGRKGHNGGGYDKNPYDAFDKDPYFKDGPYGGDYGLPRKTPYPNRGVHYSGLNPGLPGGYGGKGLFGGHGGYGKGPAPGGYGNKGLPIHGYSHGHPHNGGKASHKQAPLPKCEAIPHQFCQYKHTGHYSHPYNRSCFVHCDAFHKAFTRSCPPGTKWANFGSKNALSTASMCV